MKSIDGLPFYIIDGAKSIGDPPFYIIDGVKSIYIYLFIYTKVLGFSQISFTFGLNGRIYPPSGGLEIAGVNKSTEL